MCLSEPSKARLNRKKGAREGRARAPLAFKDEERKREKPLKRKYYGQTYCRARLTVVVTVDVFGKLDRPRCVSVSLVRQRCSPWECSKGASGTILWAPQRLENVGD
jgi:hypothetical protein